MDFRFDIIINAFPLLIEGAIFTIQITALSVAIGIIIGLFALPIMVIREYYQYKHYKLEKFEWEDIIRYSFVIIVGSIICILLGQ